MPIAAATAPRVPGLYRMTWTGASWSQATNSLPVKASKRVADRQLDLHGMQPPILLTIGRSTNIHKRIRQHFGSNPNNNRVLYRLGLLFPALTAAPIRQLAVTDIRVDWVPIADWVQRCLLEKFGVATTTPILDIEAEH